MTRAGRILAILILGAALAFRLWWAIALPSDVPGDTVLYENFASNMLHHGVYSGDDAPPCSPSYIRTPGYPLFLAGVYAVFGTRNDVAVRAVQALIDTATCLLAALLALAWCPPGWHNGRKQLAFLSALAIAAACPMVALYVGTVLSETLTFFLGTACILAATYALKKSGGRSLAWWAACGALGGLATMVRPDSGLLLMAAGGTMALLALREAWKNRQAGGAVMRALKGAVAKGASLSLAFAAVLAPWTIRNAMLFHEFMPLSPVHANMPGEFVPQGYYAWVRSWITDQRYIDPFLWELGTLPLEISQLPMQACDSPQERERVAALFKSVNPGQGQVQSGQESSNNVDEEQGGESTSGAVITPQADAEFMELAKERRKSHPFRTFLLLPATRAVTMWFDTHSLYTPFEDELLPFSHLDWQSLDTLWLLLFMGLVWFHTVFGWLGAGALLKEHESRPWLLLLLLLFAPRVIFFSTIENPEPRYLVELFPFTASLAGITVAFVLGHSTHRH